MKTRSWMLALLIASGCASHCNVIVVDGIEIYEEIWTKTQTDLRTIASYDFDCDPSQLSFRLFKRTGRHPTEVGVDGCGHRGRYVRVIAGSTGGDAYVGPWVLNGESSRG